MVKQVTANERESPRWESRLSLKRASKCIQKGLNLVHVGQGCGVASFFGDRLSPQRLSDQPSDGIASRLWSVVDYTVGINILEHVIC